MYGNLRLNIFCQLWMIYKVRKSLTEVAIFDKRARGQYTIVIDVHSR